MTRTFQWYGDTYDLPANAKILAYSDLYPQAFRIGSAVGIQFHFEVEEPPPYKHGSMNTVVT